MKHIKVALLFGGASNEYAISLRSAAAVLRHLDEKYEPILIGITQNGSWYLFRGEIDAIEQDTWWQNPSLLSALDLSLEVQGGFKTERNERILPDVIIPVLHGQNCEDGRLQGLLDLSGIPYVGCGCAASAFGMDKAVTKIIAQAYGVPVAAWLLFTREELDSDLGEAINRTEKRFNDYPVFVKAVNSGSSVGAYRADDRDSLRRALLDAAKVDDKILVEEFIRGKEVETAVFSTAKGVTAFDPGEVEPCADFYDYDTKYKNDTANYYIPARLTAEQLATVKDYAVRVFRAIGGRHLSRVDFFATDDGRIIFNEINTLPGFTSISMYPKMAEAGGLSFTQLVNALIEEALS